MENEITMLSDEELTNAFVDDNINLYLQEIKRYPVLSIEEQKKAFREGHKQALINCNLRLVVSVANRYRDKIKHLKILDIIQEGNIGLMRALETYNPDEGAFSTYAVPWITQSIARAIYAFDDDIRIPEGLEKLIQRYYYLIANNKGETFSDEEIMMRLNISKNRYNDLMAALSRNVVSYDAPINEETDSSLMDLIVDENDDNFDGVINDSDEENLKKVLKMVLSPAQYYIIYYRFLSVERKSLEELSQLFHVKIQAISKYVKSLLTKIRPYLNLNSLPYKQALQKIKEECLLDDYKTEPIDFNNVIKYLYLRDSLTYEERKIYEFLFLDNVCHSTKFYAEMLHISLEELSLHIESLKRKINFLLINYADFQRYKNDLLDEMKIRIYNLVFCDNGKLIDREYLEEKYMSLDYDTLISYFREFKFPLSAKYIAILQAYFLTPVSERTNIEYDYRLYRLLARLDEHIKKAEMANNVKKK